MKLQKMLSEQTLDCPKAILRDESDITEPRYWFVISTWKNESLLKAASSQDCKLMNRLVNQKFCYSICAFYKPWLVLKVTHCSKFLLLEFDSSVSPVI